MTQQPIYVWERQPKAEQLILNVIEESCRKNPIIAELQNDLFKHTSTRLFDWVEYVVVGDSPSIELELAESGFVSDHATFSYRLFYHPGAQLPRVVVQDQSSPIGGVALKVESIADFLMVRGLFCPIEGAPFSGFRRSCVSTKNGVSLWVIERRGVLTIEPTYPEEGYLKKYFVAKELWQTRPRDLANEDDMMKKTLALATEMVTLLGKDMAAWVVLECERAYWQAKNTAGQIQKNRQDKLGMGWANHDHHTFRSSRRHFPLLVRLMEVLGFHCRERFYAGQEAGWGAQVVENSRCGLTCFLDLDLSPEELEIDFAHHNLPELKRLGTIGLWCELHGDSIFKAGMHHLEAQFMFDDLATDLSHLGVGMMEPFSNFSYLKQAFTHGEQWHVDLNRIHRLLELGLITREQGENFQKYGAVGSHLENLQRREGYKGFNQKNVSYIIGKTDPRQMVKGA